MLMKSYSKYLSAVVLVFLVHMASFAAVTHWRADKGVDFLQTADNTQPTTPTNWYFYSDLETDAPGDATNVVITGGNIPGSMAFTQNGTYWELYVDYSSKAALDAVFPSEASYSIVLSGGTMGTVTQQFSIAADDYPPAPYLSGADYSMFQALDVLEPLEVDWDLPAEPISSVGFEIAEGTYPAVGDTVVDHFPDGTFPNEFLAGGFFAAGSNYTGFIQFSNSTNANGSGGFGVDGITAFNAEAIFPVTAVNSAIGYDDFNDNVFDGGKWTLLSVEAGKAFTETNQQCEFTSNGSVDGDSVAWGWGAGTLSYTQDWSVAIDIANLVDSGTMATDGEIYTGLGVFHSTFDHLFEIEFFKNEFVSGLYSAGTNGTTGIEVNAFTTTNHVAVKIGFDAITKMLYSAYSTGGDYTVVTNYPVASWGMTDASVFNVGFFGGSHLHAVASGQVYVDNFRIHDGPALTNNVGLTELEYLHSYGDGSIFLENNFFKVDTLTTHRVRDVTFTTASGFSESLINVWDEGIGIEWGREVPLGFSTPWNPADDGDWIVTFGFVDGTYQSTVIPFTQEDGTTPIPNFSYEPMFLPPSPANNSSITNTSLSFGWSAASSNANNVSVDEIVGDNEIGTNSFFFADSLPGENLGIVDLVKTGSLSTTNYGPVVFGEGLHRMRINQGWGRAAFSVDGVPYIVDKQNEADILFTITPDVDGDGMDDSWEILYFGSTNAANGGPLENWDGDSLNNFDEFVAGVDPTNSTSVFVVDEAGPAPEGFVINWNSVAGRKYQVYWAKTLTNSFDSVTPGYLPYPQNGYTDTVHTVEGCGFYYIDVQLDN